MWACYIGEISKPYQERWERQTICADQEEPDVYDVITDSRRIGYRLDGCAYECFSDCIRVDWGGWAYKVTKAQMEEYNRRASPMNKVPQHIIDGMKDGHVYGVIDVEIY